MTLLGREFAAACRERKAISYSCVLLTCHFLKCLMWRIDVRFVYCVVVVKARGDAYFRLNTIVLKCSAALKFSFESVHAYCRSPSACHPLRLGACCRIKILMGIMICHGAKGQCAPDRFKYLWPRLHVKWQSPCQKEEYKAVFMLSFYLWTSWSWSQVGSLQLANTWMFGDTAEGWHEGS